MGVLQTAAKGPNRCVIALWIISGLVLFLSLFLWVGFPPIFKAIVHSKLRLSQGSDGIPSQTTFLWAKPPIKNIMNFYIYNVTNVERVTFFGEKPAIVEIGPFAVW